MQTNTDLLDLATLDALFDALDSLESDAPVAEVTSDLASINAQLQTATWAVGALF